MNSQTKKYLQGRVEEALRDKIEAIKDKHTTEAVFLSDEEVVERLTNGRFRVIARPGDGYARRGLREYVEFEGESPRQVNKEAIAEEVRAVRQAARRLLDEAFLGDDERAKELLAEFEDH